MAAYVEYVDNLELCRVKKDEQIDEKKKLEEMKAVLSRYRSKEEGYQSVQQSSLQSKIERLATAIAAADARIREAEAATAEAAGTNVEELETRVAEEQERVHSLIEKVTSSETLIREATAPKEALEEAGKIKKKFDESVKRLDTYNHYQSTLKTNPASIPEREEFLQHFNIRHQLWTIRETFGNAKRRWYDEDFRDQDAALIVQTVKEKEGELTRLKAALGRDTKDEVLAAATAEVKAVSKHVALISALGNTAMTKKHWTKVSALVDTPPVSLEHVKLQELLD